MSRSHVKEKQQKKKNTEERIQQLFTTASTTASEKARKLITTARTTARKANIRLPKHYKHVICAHCNSYLHTGTNATIRTREGKLIITCKTCKNIKRIPLN